jgi:hypothetical protein
MQPYQITEYLKEGYLLLYFPPSSSWLGEARIIAEELIMFLNTVDWPMTVLIDITECRPTLTFLTIKTALSDYNKLNRHKNLKGVMLITTDYLIMKAASEFVESTPNFDLFSSRSEAISAIQKEEPVL